MMMKELVDQFAKYYIVNLVIIVHVEVVCVFSLATE